MAYDQKVEYSGPVYESMKVLGSRVILSFTHVGAGFVAKDGDLKGFTIAGGDHKHVPAVAKIEGKTVVVSASEVAKPVAVRYGWANVPEVKFIQPSRFARLADSHGRAGVSGREDRGRIGCLQAFFRQALNAPGREYARYRSHME